MKAQLKVHLKNAEGGGGGQFMGLVAIVQVGIGTDQANEYTLDFEQELLGVNERQKSWQLSCKQCREAGGLRRPVWLSRAFYTGEGEYGEAEQREQFQRVLDECNAHVLLHERMAAWYEMLDQSPAYKRGWAAGYILRARPVEAAQ